MDDLQARFVAPFYLRMARLNALACDRGTLEAVRTAGRTVATEDVVRLLRSDWRPRVMGAWFAVLHPSIGSELSRSLETSSGDLTSPALASAAVVNLGANALPALEAYAAADLSAGWGARGFVAAAIEHVGGSAAEEAATDADRRDLAGMLAVAKFLRDGSGEPEVRTSA